MKSSFARTPGAASAPPATNRTGPPPRPPARQPAPAATAAPRPPATPPPARRAAAPATNPPPEEAAGAAQHEEQQAAAPPAPAQASSTPPPPRRGRPPGSANKAKTPDVMEQGNGADTRLGTFISETGPVPYKPTAQLGVIEGDFDTTDLILPQFKVSSGAGPLRKLQVPDGMLVLGSGEDWLWLREDNPENAPLGVTILRAQKKFFQKKNEDGDNLYDIGEMGLMFDTKEEMQAANGTLQDVEGMKVFEAGMAAQVAIRMPDMSAEDRTEWDTLGLFNQVEIEGVPYAVAMWFIRGSTYRETGKKIYNDNGKVYPSGESYRVEYEATAKRIDGDKNTWWIVKLGKTNNHTEETVAYWQANA